MAQRAMKPQPETLLSPIALLRGVGRIHRALTQRRRLAGLPLVMLQRRLATRGGARANALELPSAAGRLFGIVSGRSPGHRVEPTAPSRQRGGAMPAATRSDFPARPGVPAFTPGAAPDMFATRAGVSPNSDTQQASPAAKSAASDGVSEASEHGFGSAGGHDGDSAIVPAATFVDAASRPGPGWPIAGLAGVAPAIALLMRGRGRRFERAAARPALDRAMPQYSFAGTINAAPRSRAETRIRDGWLWRALLPSKPGAPVFRASAILAPRPRLDNETGLDANEMGLDAPSPRTQTRPSINIHTASPIVIDSARPNLWAASPTTTGVTPAAGFGAVPLQALRVGSALLDSQIRGAEPAGDSALHLPRRSPERAPIGIGAVVALTNVLRGFVVSELDDIRKAVERISKRPNAPQTPQVAAVSDDMARRVLGKIREIVQEERFRSGKLR